MFPTNLPKCLNCFRKLYSCRVVFIRSFSQNFPLGAPVSPKCSLDLAVTYILGSLSDEDDDGSENGKKYNRFISAKQQLCKCITLFYTFVCRHMLHDYDVKMPNFMLCGERELRATTSFLFF